MIFTLTTSYPQNVDTILRYMTGDEAPTFSCPELQSAFDAAFGGDDFSFDKGTVKTYRFKFAGSFVNLVLAKLDVSNQEKALDHFRKLTLKVGSILNDLKATIVFCDCFDTLDFMKGEEISRQFAATLPLCDYAFDKYLTKKADDTEKEIFVYTKETLITSLQEGANIAQGICIARDLVNEPADVMTPVCLANCAKEFGENFGFEVEIFGKDACEEMGMNAFLAVAKGSVNEPQLIVMRYRGGEGPAKGIIGKGLCYDSGGYALKPGNGMENMKCDMAGSAAAIGAMCAIAKNKLPVNVTAVVAACENMLDGSSYRNGDVIRSMSGKTIFVENTDAEGRTTMADAITYIIEKEHVENIIELSTLTGSCANFFRDVCCGVVTTDDVLFQKLSDCSPLAGEKYWRLPYYEEYREFLKADIADLTNTSNNGAGGITAGLFLDEFSGDTPFVHMDIAGLAFDKKKKPGYPGGATGFGVKTLYQYMKNM